MHSHIDFGYDWRIIYAHLFILFPAALLLAVALRRHWRRWITISLALITLWSLSSFFIVRFLLDFNSPMTLPVANFFPSGKGKVLDIGAGTGRSTLAVLEARPNATLVAIDLFERSYADHFGNISDARIVENLREAGVLNRATVKKADMRELPFPAGEFDAVLSAYAIDHVGTAGIRKSLAEAARVSKPGSDFLLLVMNKDNWVRFIWGPVVLHGGTRSPQTWIALLNEAGFDVIEHGTQPFSLHFLARRR